MTGFSKILIVQTAFAGDVILSTPLAEALKRCYPSSEVHFLAIPGPADLLKNNPFISRIWIFDKRGLDKSPLKLIKWMRRLKAEQYDLAVVPHRSIRSASLVRGAAIPRIVGFDKSAGRILFTDVVKYPNCHEVDRNLKLLSVIGCDERMAPKLFPGEAEEAAVNAFLSETGVENEPFISMAPGSVWPTKRWLPEYFAETAGLLYKNRRVRTVLIGGQSERELGEYIQQNAGESVVNSMGALSHLASAALIRRSALMVSNDSAPAHLAAAVNIPVIAVFGPTIPAFGFGPYGPDHIIVETDLICRPCGIHGGKRCKEIHFKCMRDILPLRIMAEIEKVLK
jgi:heptosyltransferase-2